MNIDSRDISATPISSEGSFPQRKIELFKEIGYGSIRRTTQERYDQTWQAAMKQIRWKEACISRNIGMFMAIKHHNLLLFIVAVFDEFERVEIPLPVLELLYINLCRAYNEGTVKIQHHVMISIFRDIANGLNCLHSHNKPIVVHCNVILSASSIQLEPQPGNLQRAKLSDFGSENFLKEQGCSEREQ